MSIIHKAFRGAGWLAMFRAVSQTISWVATIVIARTLVPEDFGLMEMATILTGYVLLFSELGLGAAVVQRENIRDEELSSLFWFVVFWGFFLAIVSIILAYPTVAIFNEKRILRVTQSVSLLFMIGSFLIVPVNILQREMRFKAFGFMEACSIIISCIMMIIIAKLGGGVWTLIGGYIIREFVKFVMVFFILPWRPSLHFRYSEIKPFIKYGLNIATANSLYYVYMKSDRFFAGRALGPNTLGFYSLALQLSDIPTEKLVSLINSVSFPVFSRFQSKPEEFNNFFLKLTSLIASLTFPIYLGGIFIADQLIPLILGSKWIPIILPFKLLCVSQLLISVTTANGMVNNAQGRPRWNLYLNTINCLVLPVSFYIAASHGINYLVIPWLTVNLIIRLGYTWVTLRKLGIYVTDYLKVFLQPCLATVVMLLALVLSKAIYTQQMGSLIIDQKVYLSVILMIGAVTYAAYFMVFRRGMLYALVNLWKGRG
jgi:O-antigen/teichoic acid export membrane protein